MSVEFAENTDARKVRRVIRNLDLKPPVIIKPNWGFSVVFTEALILDWVLDAIEEDAIVVQSYGWARCKEAVFDKKYGPFNRDALRESDKWFLEYSGIGKILKKHNLEYLNGTEEIWAGRNVDPAIARNVAEKKYAPVRNENMYGFVPERLLEMKNRSFLSLAKLKFMGEDIVISLALKNFFGMIPGPDRGQFHGEENKAMNSSVVDIVRIYQSLFSVSGIVEAILRASKGMTLEPEIFEKPSLLWASKDIVQLDAQVAANVGINPEDVGYLREAAECFGKWDEQLVKNAPVVWKH